VLLLEKIVDLWDDGLAAGPNSFFATSFYTSQRFSNFSDNDSSKWA
jgi:hypothetical protein